MRYSPYKDSNSKYNKAVTSNLYSFTKYSKTFRVMYCILMHTRIYFLQLGNCYSKWLTILVNKKEENYNFLWLYFLLYK